MFDIARANAMSKVTLEEEREFLSAQRLEGKQGSTISKDMYLSKQESRRRNWDEEKQHCAIKALQEQEKLDLNGLTVIKF